MTYDEKKASINPDTLTIFVKNLPFDANADEIGDFFKDCGKIRDVRLVYNSVNRNFKGFAYIEFLSFLLPTRIAYLSKYLLLSFLEKTHILD